MSDFILPQNSYIIFIIIVLSSIFRLSLHITHCTHKGTAAPKAQSTYEHLLDLTEDPTVLAPLRFLREQESAHFQRFGEHWILQEII